MFPNSTLSSIVIETPTNIIMGVRTSVLVLTLAVMAGAGSLADVKHVVMIMFENRSFDHVGTRSSPFNFSKLTHS